MRSSVQETHLAAPIGQRRLFPPLRIAALSRVAGVVAGKQVSPSVKSSGTAESAAGESAR
jgi:hypothetical protein